jgi:signal peptidase II
VTLVQNIRSFILGHRLLWLILLAGFIIVSDQATKHWAKTTLATQTEDSEGRAYYIPSRTIEVVPKTFNLIYRENSAAAFSITSSLPDWFRRPFLLSVSSIATIIFLIWYFRIKEQNAWLITCFCLIMGGAVGNLIDRARMGYVVDFIDVYAEFLGYMGPHWPTFNVADSSIVVGAIGIFLISLFSPKPSEKTDEVTSENTKQ